MEKTCCVLKNTQTQWGFLSRFLHWFMMLLVFGALGAGFYMASLTDMTVKGPIIFIHKSVGVLILALLVFRFIWRQMNTIPAIPDMPMAFLSRLSAPVLYLSLFSMPLSGIAMSQFAGYPVSFFGLFTLPTVFSKSPEMAKLFREVHETCALILIALIVIHTLAAFFHHFVLKDTVFLRMLKNIPPKEEK